MATSSSPSSPAEQKTNHSRLSRLLVDIGTRVLQEVFDGIHPPSSLHGVLNSGRVHRKLLGLQSRKVLYLGQWNTLYPSSGTVDSKNFDITLLFLLLRNICSLTSPATGWDKAPLPTDLSKEADLVRIKRSRNELYAHRVEMSLTDSEFESNWNQIQNALLRLGGTKYQADIQRLKFASMDPKSEKHFHALLQSWEEGDETIRKGQDELLQEIHSLKERLEECNRKESDEEKCRKKQREQEKDAELYSQKLKTATIHGTEMRPQGVGSLGLFEEVKTDQIFANLTIHDGPPKLQKSSEVRASNETRKEIQASAEIFLSRQPSKENPKTILIDGKAGIGKTLFTHKLARDWAKDCIFDQDESSRYPDIKFAYRITFRQLNLLDEEKLSLMELLNLSSTLDGRAMLTDEVFQYIIEHPQQLLVFIDGYDEFKHRDKITSDFESKSENDPRQKMHAAAIVSKLVRKKIMRNSVIVLTSRTSEAIQMAEKIHCDRYLEISGFSKPQRDNYVEKYFEVKPEQIKAKALNKVKSSPHYISFGAVPLLCYLMCVVLEWEVKDNLSCDNSVSKNLTEFYNHVLYIIERHYNRRISSLDGEAARSAVNKTLDNFSRLCARLILQNRFSFTIKDLKKLKISEEEILYLTSSSLLCCNPIVSNSPIPEIISQEYSFHHFSFQEFLAARHFVSINKIPAKMTEMISQFMSGLMDPETNEQLMVDLLQSVGEQVGDVYRDRLVSLRCLFEYKNKDFVTRVLMANHHQRYWDSDGLIVLWGITDIDCRCIAMLVDTLSAVRLTSPLYRLYIIYSSLTSYGLDVLLAALTNNNCTITGLRLNVCELDDDCVKMVACSLPHSNITELSLLGNNITDDGVTTLVNHCSKLTCLDLNDNSSISDECRYITRQLCKSKYPGLVLYIK